MQYSIFMIEYRLNTLPDVMRMLLEEAEAFIGEEEFQGKTTYLIYSEDDITDILRELDITFESKNTEETNWQEKWKEYIQEDYLTEDIFFVFEKNKAFDDNRRTLYINPSLAFGTGAHPTTKIAAQLLSRCIKGKTMLDVGTGSGILSIAASMYGAEHVDAFDIDPLSHNNCIENIENNNCNNIYAWIGDIKDVNKTYDVVCANIISSVLLSIKDKINEISMEYVIYSGILDSEYDNIKEQLCNGYIEEERITINEWTGVRLKKC